MRFPYRFTGKGSAEQRVEKNHGLTKQHIQSFEASCYAFLYIVGIQSVRILKRLRRRTHRFFPPSDQFDKTSLCKNLRGGSLPVCARNSIRFAKDLQLRENACATPNSKALGRL